MLTCQRYKKTKYEGVRQELIIKIMNELGYYIYLGDQHGQTHNLLRGIVYPTTQTIYLVSSQQDIPVY